MKDCTTCKYGYEDERLGILMCHHPKRFSEDCVDYNMHEEKEIKESEKPINLDDAMKELDEKIELVKRRGTWDGVDVDKYMDEVRGREPEKPINLEDEMERFIETFGWGKTKHLAEKELISATARHFAEWGYLRAAEKYNEIEYIRQRAEESVPNDLEEAAYAYAEQHGFRVPYDGTNIFYDEVDVKASKEGFIAGAKWQKEQKPELIQHPPITYTYPSDASRDERLKRAIIALLNSDLIKVAGNKFTKQDLIDWVEKQKPVEWSEEDENMIGYFMSLLQPIRTFFPKEETKAQMRSWLKSLRPQPKAKLTLLDENIINAAVAFVEQNDHFNCWRGIDKHTVIKALRSLKPHWKPSEEQMKALERASTNKYLSAKQFDILVSLYEHLKKLMED